LTGEVGDGAQGGAEGRMGANHFEDLHAAAVQLLAAFEFLMGEKQGPGGGGAAAADPDQGEDDREGSGG